jgi:hypothetical protein
VHQLYQAPLATGARSQNPSQVPRVHAPTDLTIWSRIEGTVFLSYRLVLEVLMNARALVFMLLGIAFGALSNAYAEPARRESGCE